MIRRPVATATFHPDGSVTVSCLASMALVDAREAGRLRARAHRCGHRNRARTAALLAEADALRAGARQMLAAWRVMEAEAAERTAALLRTGAR